MSNIRPPAVAGTFYPDDPAVLRNHVAAAISQAARETPPIKGVRAIIAPHAGYVYSGPVAAHAFAAIGDDADIRRIVLMGPAHTVPLSGIAAPRWDAFATPLGTVPVDVKARAKIARLPFVTISDTPHAREHALEVELPFIQVLFPGVPVLPLVVGQTAPEDIARLMEELWDDHTLFVISSDLSHYEPYSRARAHDDVTAQHIAVLDASAIGPHDACGAYPLKGLLLEARRHGLKPILLDLRNSGDTAGDKSHVVGYGAWAFA